MSVALSEDAFARTVRAVLQVEQDGPTPHEDAQHGLLPVSLCLALKATSATASTTGADGTCNYAIYPAVVLQWDSSVVCWTEQRAVWMAQLTGTTVTSGSRYFGMMVEDSHTISGDTRPLFVALSC